MNVIHVKSKYSGKWNIKFKHISEFLLIKTYNHLRLKLQTFKSSLKRELETRRRGTFEYVFHP